MITALRPQLIVSEILAIEAKSNEVFKFGLLRRLIFAYGTGLVEDESD